MKTHRNGRRRPARTAARAIAPVPAIAIATAIGALFVLTGCTPENGITRGSGTIEATVVTVSARTTGTILELAAEEGTSVAAGDLLARLDTTAMELELAQAQHNVAVLEAQLALLLAGAREEDLRQARATVDQAQESLDLALRSLERTEQLHAGGSATSSELDRVRTEYEMARSRLTGAQAALDRLVAYARPEELRAAEARLAGARATVDRIQNRIDDATLRSPIDGVILTRVHEPGEFVAPGSPLCTVADLSVVTLTVYIPEPALASVRLNETARVTVDGVSDRAFTGRVSWIADRAEFTPKNVQTAEARSRLVYAVEITLDNREGIFKIGMPADAEFGQG